LDWTKAEQACLHRREMAELRCRRVPEGKNQRFLMRFSRLTVH